MVHTVACQIIEKAPLNLALAPKESKKLKQNPKFPRSDRLHPHPLKNPISNTKN